MKVVVIGVGNRLIGDDGFGTYFTHLLKKYCVIDAEIYDLEVRSIDIINLVSNADLAIVIDIAYNLDEKVEVYKVDVQDFDINDIAQLLDNIHNVGPITALVLAYASKFFNGDAYAILIKPYRVEFWKGFSKEVVTQVPEVLDKLIAILRRYGLSCRCDFAEIMRSFWKCLDNVEYVFEDREREKLRDFQDRLK